MMMKRLVWTIVVAVAGVVGARGQMIAASTDALWLATTSPNLGLELVVGERSTLGLNALWTRKPLGKDVQIKALQPELRYFFSGRPMYREFVGIGAIGAIYDITWAGKVYDGTAVGAGLTFGYVLPLTRRLNLDFHAGFGMIFYKQKEYFVGDNYDAEYIINGELSANATGYYLLPTRFGISLSYILK